MSAEFDVALERLLDEWAPRIGLPTCDAGCSRCCEGMTVIVSSAEALEIVDHCASRQPDRLDAIGRRLASFHPPPEREAAIDALLDLGPCPLLDADRRCGVYEARPDACRACYVWHPAEHCGRSEFDMCTPAELNALRVDVIHRRMLAELESGRRPFWGQLAPMLSVLTRQGQSYKDGADLSEAVDANWVTAGLIEFPCPGGAAAEIRRFLEGERETLRQVFEDEAFPMGFPRAAEASDRSYLAAFPLK